MRVGADALAVDAELEGRRGLPAFTREDPRVLLEAFENFSEAHAAGLEIA